MHFINVVVLIWAAASSATANKSIPMIEPSTTVAPGVVQVIEIVPTTLKTMKMPNKRSCHKTTLYGGQAVITKVVCDSAPTHCAVCVGCNAPVTICS